MELFYSIDDLQKGFVTTDDPIATPSASEILGTIPIPSIRKLLSVIVLKKHHL